MTFTAIRGNKILAKISEFCSSNIFFFQNEILSKLRSEIFPKFIGILEKLLRENSSSSGFFVGESVSIASTRDVFLCS